MWRPVRQPRGYDPFCFESDVQDFVPRFVFGLISFLDHNLVILCIELHPGRLSKKKVSSSRSRREVTDNLSYSPNRTT